MTELDITTELWNLPLGERENIKTWIYDNPLNLTPDRLFSLGFRYNNTKRSFMFVSKVLGKHTPVKPENLIQMTRSLANVYFDKNIENETIQCSRDTLIIGFAEAAVAMGQIFFDVLQGNVSFVHSTRENPEGADPLLQFREPHSHAPFHNFYMTNDELIKNAEEIILVDDEVTSGNTALGVILKIDSLYPGKSYGIASFLDWRNEEDQKAFESLKEQGITIKCRSLLYGKIDLDKVVIPSSEHMPLYKEVKNYNTEKWTVHKFDFCKTDETKVPYLKQTGRFGLDQKDRTDLETAIIESAKKILTWLPEGRSLFLGTGEFLYIPLKLAEYCGSDVFFQSVTRTPNLPLNENNYDIGSLDTFPSPLDPERDEYLYNLKEGDFDNVLLFLERKWPLDQLIPLLSILDKKGFSSCHLVFTCE